MAKDWMIEYHGPKKVMTVPFPADNKLPLVSMSELDETVTFPKGQPVPLAPARAQALLKQAPGIFRLVDKLRQRPQAETVRSQTRPAAPQSVELTEEEYEAEYGPTNQDPALQDPESADVD